MILIQIIGLFILAPVLLFAVAKILERVDKDAAARNMVRLLSTNINDKPYTDYAGPE